MLSSLVFLPIAVPQEWMQPVSGTPVIWLIGLFTVVLGLPFFALSANAPLMQKWFSYTTHEKAADPYFLYAASNVGSLFSLLSYPFLIEPFFTVSQQSFAWAFGFVALMIALMACGVLAFGYRSNNSTQQKSHQAAVVSDNEQTHLIKHVKNTDRLFWMLCALVPSGLMLAVTTHITSNIASAPLLWVLPLALFLLTFIVAFAPKPYISTRFLKYAFIPSAGLMVISSQLHLSSYISVGIEVLIHLVGFFFITQLCHNRLAENRPAAKRLTEFYLFMSLGGVLGGACVALLAPVLFTGANEYSLMLIFAALVVSIKTFNFEINRQNLPSSLLLLAAVFFVAGVLPPFSDAMLRIMMIMLAAILVVLQILNKPVFLKNSIYLMSIWALSSVPVIANNSNIFADRSFFGISRVKAEVTDAGTVHTFIHGNTVHNKQLRGEANENYPLSYYAPQGTFGQAIDAVRSQRGPLKVAAVGLGAGALACHIQQQEDWTFYEIDPLVEKMARDKSLFSFIDRCAPSVPIKIGDARLTLADEAKGSHDMIIIDAFSSDSVPAHLLTKEALAMYQSLLKEDGFVFFHTSNRNLDVSSVVMNVASDSALSSRKIYFSPDETMKHHAFVSPSEAVMVGKDEALESLFKDNPAWKKETGHPLVGVWRDDFTHIMGAYIARYLPNKE